MIDHSTSPQPTQEQGLSRTAILLPAILFAVMLFFAVIVTLRYAHGWAEPFASGAAATTPLAVDGLTGLASIVLTALGGVWLYMRRLVR